MQPVVATLTLTKSTKGTHVYSEAMTSAASFPGAVFPTIYIQKSALPTPPPATITVTIQGAQ